MQMQADAHELEMDDTRFKLKTVPCRERNTLERKNKLRRAAMHMRVDDACNRAAERECGTMKRRRMDGQMDVL